MPGFRICLQTENAVFSLFSCSILHFLFSFETLLIFVPFQTIKFTCCFQKVFFARCNIYFQMKNGYYTDVFRIGQFLPFSPSSFLGRFNLFAPLVGCIASCIFGNFLYFWRYLSISAFFNSFQPSVMFLLETSHLFYAARQMTGFYTKRSTGLKWVNLER